MSLDVSLWFSAKSLKVLTNYSLVKCLYNIYQAVLVVNKPVCISNYSQPSFVYVQGEIRYPVLFGDTMAKDTAKKILGYIVLIAEVSSDCASYFYARHL